MKWKRIALVLITFSLLVVPLAWSQGGNAEQHIKKLNDQVNAANVKGDTSFLEKVLADDYTAIRGDGSVLTKAEEIEKMKSGAIKYQKVDLQDVKVRVYGNTAITVDLSTTTNMRNGIQRTGSNRTTRIWVKQKGDWKCVSYQTTRVPSAS
jgi:uncharacterized protein (TIGR02246 family)